TDAQGLRTGAAVRLAGVEIGSVHRVLVNPQRKDCPAEAEIGVAASNDIRIPRDALVRAGTAGVLGETYLEIDIAAASGPPVEEYGYLKTMTTGPPPSFEDLIKNIGSVVKHLRGAEADDDKPCPPPPDKREAKATPSRRP